MPPSSRDDDDDDDYDDNDDDVSYIVTTVKMQNYMPQKHVWPSIYLSIPCI